MQHFASPDFWFHYRRLPESAQRVADRSYRLLTGNPRHPSLHFKHIRGELWSVRVGRRYRALAAEDEDAFIWFWIGSHADYDDLIK